MMPKRKKRSGFVQKKRVAFSKSLPYIALGSLDDYFFNDKILPKTHDLGQMNHHCFDCASLMWNEENHTGTLGHSAVFSTFCLEGKILLPTNRYPPLLLQHLLTDETDEEKKFVTT